MSSIEALRRRERLRERISCARPGCPEPAADWDQAGRLCDACALERDLFERDVRWAVVAGAPAG